MRIILDQDQVICDWVKRILEWYNEDKGTSFTKTDIKTWNMTMNLGPESEDFLRSSMRYPELYRDLDPIECSLKGVKKLIDNGHDVIIATAVPKCAGIAYHGKLEWLRRNMPFFPLNNFIAIQRKDLLDADVLLDDGLHNISQWVKMDNRIGVVFDNPWNKCDKDITQFGSGSKLRRVKHWNEFLKLIDELSINSSKTTAVKRR